MPFCHGNGSPNNNPPGCCIVEGVVCTHRVTPANFAAWKTANGITSGANRTRADLLMVGVSYACGIALRLLATTPSFWTNRAAFDNAWNNDAQYLAFPRPQWIAVEQRNGLPTGSYQCSTWGPASGQCCFGEDPVTNAARAALLSATKPTGVTVTPVSLRQSRGT